MYSWSNISQTNSFLFSNIFNFESDLRKTNNLIKAQDSDLAMTIPQFLNNANLILLNREFHISGTIRY